MLDPSSQQSLFPASASGSSISSFQLLRDDRKLPVNFSDTLLINSIDPTNYTQKQIVNERAC